jgi:hypothetical protein
VIQEDFITKETKRTKKGSGPRLSATIAGTTDRGVVQKCVQLDIFEIATIGMAKDVAGR